MKIYNPIFSLILLVIQLILSFEDYYALQEWKKANPELDSLFHPVVPYNSLFIFVLIIGVYEVLTKPGLAKKLILIFLVCIVVGFEFAGVIPIENFGSGVYNTAWFSAVVAFILILIRFGKYGVKKITNRSSNRTQKASRQQRL